jgi:hypothetical protein
MINTLKKVKNKVNSAYTKAGVFMSLLGTGTVFADDNPFPDINIGGGGDVVQATGSRMETALKYGLVGGGGLLILICLGVIIHRIRDDSREKDHGNLVMTYILLALGLTIGFILIALGWKAFSTPIQN